MNILEKIENVRKSPEPVRIRYVVTSVSVSMFFVITIWLFSLAASFRNLIPHVPVNAQRITGGTETTPESLKNLMELGQRLEDRSETKESDAPAEGPIEKLDPNFGQHPVPDNVPTDSTGNPYNPLTGTALPKSDTGGDRPQERTVATENPPPDVAP